MIEIAIAVVYLAGFVYCWRRMTWHFAQDRFNTYGEAVIFGLVSSLVWPLVVLTMRKSFALAPRDVRRAEREKAAQQRIAELERELGIR